jgi:DNA-binding MarR family transcriptional regulator
VAFTIEFDNEFEHRMPNWTTGSGRAGGPAGAVWLVSQVMWANVMAHIPAEGITIDELHARARTERDSLAGLRRWGYVKVDAEAGVVRPRAAGRRAQEVWRPLAAEVEKRWRARFGPAPVAALREALLALIERFEVAWPRYLPITSPTQNRKLARGDGGVGGDGGVDAVADADLSVLLSQVLLQFTADFETESRISLPISANTLRVLTAEGVPIRELPKLTGVSKEANSMALGLLARVGCVTEEPVQPGGRGKLARLTPKGQKAQEKYRRLLAATEDRWADEFGPGAVDRLRAALEPLVDGGRLAEGLVPYPDGWRAAVRRPATLPHYPMVLHRGGFPDGS